MTDPPETAPVPKTGSGLGAVIVVGILAMVALIIFGQNQNPSTGQTPPLPTIVPSPEQIGDIITNQNAQEPVAGLPRLVDLGTLSCQPCKMMVPVLEELRQKYAGRMQVEFINVAEDRAAGQKYGVRAIPLQIFFDPSGKELFRHEGYWPTAEIMAKWKELGFDFE